MRAFGVRPRTVEEAAEEAAAIIVEFAVGAFAVVVPEVVENGALVALRALTFTGAGQMSPQPAVP